MKKLGYIFLSSLLALFTQCLVSADNVSKADIIPVEDFFRSPDIAQPRVAPDGKHLAFLMPVEGKMSVILWDLATGKAITLARTFDADISELYWKGSEHIVFSGDPTGGESRVIFSVNITTKAIIRLSEAYDENKHASASFARVIDKMDLDPDHLLIFGRSSEGGSSVGLFFLNINNGKRSVAPNDDSEFDEVGESGADQYGVIRFQTRYKKERKSYEVKASEKSGWKEVGFIEEGLGASFDPIRFIGFASDNKTLYSVKTEADGSQVLYGLNTETLEWGKPIFTAPHAQITDLQFSSDRSQINAIYYEGVKDNVFWINPRLATIAKALDGALPAHTFKRMVSMDKKEQVIVIAVYSDQYPVEYFLLDIRGKTQLVRLGRTNSRLKSKLLQPMQDITYTARDGLVIHGYLTLPKEAKNGVHVPLIIHPHGGPYGIKDSWGYNPEVQFLVNRGYAVLQPNYRGSGGYGLDFLKAGRKEWGRKMQNDLTDAVSWAIAQGFVDPTRVCIYGASYGGYAALAGAVFTPTLYCCAVNYVGVSDLKYIANWEREMSDQGNAFYKNMIGDDSDFMKERSPVNFVENIQIPTLHAYGENDPRVVIGNWTELEAQLKKFGKNYEYIRQENEGHGFHKEEARVGFYKQLDQFLDKYLQHANNARVLIKDTKVVEMPARP